MNESVELSMTSSEPKKSKSVLWRNIAFIFGLGAISFMIYKIGVDTIFKNIGQIGFWFFAIISVWGLVYLINACAWYIIIKDEENQSIRFKDVLKLTISGYALNYITPFGLAGGEPYRIMELSKYVGTDKATSSVILYAMMHVCSHFFFWLTSIALIAWFVPLQLPLSIAMSIIVAVCLVLIYFFFRGYKKGLVVTITRILGKLPIVGKKIALMSPATKERLNIIDGQIKNLKGQRVKTFYMALSLEYLARLINCCEIMLIIYALGHHASYIDALIILALSSLFANIMFFSPMQLGTREGGLFLAFKTVGLVPSLSVSVSLITRIRELFWIMIGILIMKIKVKK